MEAMTNPYFRGVLALGAALHATREWRGGNKALVVMIGQIAAGLGLNAGTLYANYQLAQSQQHAIFFIFGFCFRL